MLTFGARARSRACASAPPGGPGPCYERRNYVLFRRPENGRECTRRVASCIRLHALFLFGALRFAVIVIKGDCLFHLVAAIFG